ncbi:2-dehydro-3-deoxy-D-gluconate 5-dehydrogenase [Aspergillus lentulus]|uniref:2-dehydro-3-deoxy-D-gluconate 5-dehydrogenase n=1 Tax=Aspergillus lentulus TaxID=293939 RepID=A0ABQ1A4Q5_ASPLE|nr:2-dehydro-3-deoxy-D-gluconate 5-dehydrogenase [Aspergillus lentulus]GFF24341.1 2-dehydro-3-deoxy-D-gluconate 5-dehydrogenase [Aspergillus lentulus]GFF55083.1 2-dehydro-3-deoxy-D-gluconate 5-dehydrogenase [Aspergillus lentulus]GFF73475.1 2-dehydro-3-deoxy-D-gluconate 5-dehydrogenase [Aspergillus lentulus]GFF91818.1 2-dehydro-3-deoxy-D-gluconate 5-dehydrogenase [Aspergillus lentulus]GFG12167.1 2-dehydro-3-deoxy-D-gluconate 5-dehydrogenase [Aspergillus lentulus]
MDPAPRYNFKDINVHDLEAATLFEVKGYVAVVTGAGNGVGLMAAQTLAANGARVYIISTREEILDTIGEKYSFNGQITPLPGDTSTTDGIRGIAAELIKVESKGINILINSAGVTSEPRAKATSSDIDFTDPDAVSRWMTRDGADAWRIAYAGNVWSHHFLTAALLPLLVQGAKAAPGHSSVVLNVASVAGVTKTHSQGQFAYSSSKAALIHLTREWAHTFMPLGVRVNCIVPGVFPNEISMGRFDEDRRSRQEEELGKKFPAGRVGRESDIGSVVLYICSKAGTYVNGQIVHVDGGEYHFVSSIRIS